MPDATQATTTDGGLHHHVPRSTLKCSMPSGPRSDPTFPAQPKHTRSAAIVAEPTTRCASGGFLIRLVTGCSWVDVEAILGWVVSDTTLRARRDEWIAAGVFDALAEEALAAYDRIVGLDLTEVAIDGSQHNAPAGGEGTGPIAPTVPAGDGSGGHPPGAWRHPL